MRITVIRRGNYLQKVLENMNMSISQKDDTQEDDLIGRQLPSKTTLQEYNLTGKCPQRKTFLQESNVAK